MKLELPMDRSKKTLLVMSQVFVPDPAAVGQYVAEAAFAMAERGHRVIVLTSDRGYDDTTHRYPARELIRGVEVHRLPLTSFGKRAMTLRVAGTASFMFQAVCRSILCQGVDGLLFSTSPPLIGIAAALSGFLRSIPIAYWAMDLNPDQLVALGKLAPFSPLTKLLGRANKSFLDRAALVIALDKYMVERLRMRSRMPGELLIVPPWPLEDLDVTSPTANEFRRQHGLEDKFVVMYSGNHTASNPLDTLVKAAIRLRDHDDLRFVFVGGGLGKLQVEEARKAWSLRNVLSLPYQPLATLAESLSAADVHVVSLGNPMVGIIHPSKVYGAMAVGRPILYFGPRRSHIGDLLDEADIGLHVSHGDVDGAVAAVLRFKGMAVDDRSSMGAAARTLLRGKLGREDACAALCDGLEKMLGC